MSKRVDESFFQFHEDFACSNLGGEVLYASNQDFARARNLIKPHRGIFDPDAFTVVGKEMDGWETSRHAEMKRGGSDFCIIKLAAECEVFGVDMDTLHFTGNFVEEAKVEALLTHADQPWFNMTDDALWTEVVPRTKLVSGTPEDGGHNMVTAAKPVRATHVRLSVYPDGGIARLRVFARGCGLSKTDEKEFNPPLSVTKLSCAKNGAHVIACSNAFYSHPNNLLKPFEAPNMGDGWETKRIRGYKGDNFKEVNDWVVVRLCGNGALVSAVEVDTNWFVYNYPYHVSLQACDSQDDTPGADVKWVDLVAPMPGKPNAKLVFRGDDIKVAADQRVTHVRLTIYPCGGVSRLNVYGTPAPASK
jgi:allantoicase